MKHLHLLCALGLLQWSCTDESAPDSDPASDAGMGAADSRPESFIWDSGSGRGDGGAPLFDGTPPQEPDAGPVRCFREGAGLVEEYVGDPIQGLTDIRVDVDYDGDGVNEILLQRTDATGVQFDFLSAADLTVVGSAATIGAKSGRVMPGLVGSDGQITARTMAGQTVFVLSGERETGETTLHVHNIDTGTETAQADLGPNVRRIQLFEAGATWHALVDGGSGTCSIYRLPAATLAETWQGCRLHVGWDTNEDGLRDIVRTGDGGFTVFDGQVLEQIAQDATLNPIAVGFGATGPKDYRGEGPEILTATVEMGGDLLVRYHDPVELTPRTEGEAVPLNGVFVNARFVEVGDATRLVGEYHRVELKLLGLLEVTDGLRRLGEYGSVTVLEWDIEADADGNGSKDLRISAGAREGGFQTPIEYADLANGMVVHSIPDERAARFDAIWDTADPPTAADIDGCEGLDYLTMRSGPLREGGNRATRLIVTSDGAVRYRGETYDGPVHKVVMAVLTEEGLPKVFEIRSENADSARLRILGVGSPDSE